MSENAELINRMIVANSMLSKPCENVVLDFGAKRVENFGILLTQELGIKYS